MTIWYAFTFHGGASSNTPRPAKGPFTSVKEAKEAIKKFRFRHGSLAGEYLTITSPILYAYGTNAAARRGDVERDSRLAWYPGMPETAETEDGDED